MQGGDEKKPGIGLHSSFPRVRLAVVPVSVLSPHFVFGRMARVAGPSLAGWCARPGRGPQPVARTQALRTVWPSLERLAFGCRGCHAFAARGGPAAKRYAR